MKKTLFAIATLALITTACSGNSKENGNDSVTADTTEATMRQEEKVDTFYSPDLAMYNPQNETFRHSRTSRLFS